jgi:hypothetical protein
MAQDIVGSLFGIQQQAPDYADQDYRNAIALANTNNPQAMGRFLGGMIGSQLGRTAGGMLSSAVGVEDPRLKRQKLIAMAQQQGYNPTTPEGAKQIAEFFRQNGDLELATRATLLGNQMLESQATVQAKTQEKLSNTGRMLQEAGLQPGTPEFQKAMQQAWMADVQGKTTPKTVVNVSQQQESEFSKELGKIQGKQMEKAYNTRDAAVSTLGTLTKMSELNDQQLISGSFAGGRVGAANLLNTLGLASETDAKRLSNSQQFNKVAGDLVLANIKQLGYNPSNADVKFLNETLPNLESSPAARRSLINWMATKAQGSIAEVKNMEGYALKNRSLNGYTPNIPNFNPTGGTTSANMPKPTSEMTTEELLAMRKKLTK